MKVWIVYSVTMCPDLFDFDEGIQDATQIAGVYTNESKAKFIQEKLSNSCKGVVDGRLYDLAVVVDECDID